MSQYRCIQVRRMCSSICERDSEKCKTGAINEVTFYVLERVVIQGLTFLFGYPQVRFGRVLIGSTKLSHCLNPGLDLRFGSCLGVNFEPDFG